MIYFTIANLKFAQSILLTIFAFLEAKPVFAQDLTNTLINTELPIISYSTRFHNAGDSEIVSQKSSKPRIFYPNIFDSTTMRDIETKNGLDSKLVASIINQSQLRVGQQLVRDALTPNVTQPETRAPNHGGQGGTQSEPLTTLMPLSGSNSCADFQVFPQEIISFAEMAKLRKNISSELDQIRIDKVVALAKMYLALGFGSETIQILDLLSNSNHEAKITAEIARILDDRADIQPFSLAAYSLCENSIAFWAFIQNSQLDDDLPVNVPHVVRQFFDLPSPAQKAVAKRFRVALQNKGEVDSALLLDRFLARDSTEGGFTNGFARNEIAGSAGEATLETELLDSSNTSVNLPDTVDNYSKAVNRLFELGKDIPFDAIDTLNAFRVELSNSPFEAGILKSLALANARNQRFDISFALLGDLILMGTDVSLVTNSIMQEVATSASDYNFLQVSLGHATNLPVELNERTVNLTTSRLLEVGFPEEAVDFFRKHNRSLPNEHYPEFLMRALIALGDVPEIEKFVDKAENGLDPTLRAKALVLLGRHSEATKVLEGVENVNEPSSHLWQNFSRLENASVIPSDLEPVVRLQSVNRDDPLDAIEDEAERLSSSSRQFLGDIESLMNIVNLQ